jgi:hypothetical protein
LSGGGGPFHPSHPSSIHPGSSSWKKKMMEEEEEEEKTPVVLQFAKSYKLIFKN